MRSPDGRFQKVRPVDVEGDLACVVEGTCWEKVGAEIWHREAEG